MKIKTEEIVTMTEANQNFSKVARKVEKQGRAIIFKHNSPKYLILDISNGDYLDLTDDEKIDIVAKRVLKEYKNAFLELAK